MPSLFNSTQLPLVNRHRTFLLASWLVLLLVGGSPQVSLGSVSYLKQGTPYFDTDAVVEVREDAGEVILPVKVRGGDPGALGPSFAFATIDGTAKAGSDFVAPTLTFAYLLQTGGSTQVKIPILNPPGTGTEVSETFTVALTHPGSNLPLTLPTTERQSVVVRIIDSVDDKPPPSPVLAANLPTTVPPGKPFVITGVATDEKGVRNVYVSYDDSTDVPAKLGAPGATRTTFSATVHLTNVVTQILVHAEDTQGNRSDYAFHRVYLSQPAPLTVNFDESMGSVTPGFAGTTMRQIGTRYTISAIPKKKPAGAFIFERWETVPGSFDTSASELMNPTLSFVHRPGIELTAKFAPNRYRNLGGTYLANVYHREDRDDEVKYRAGQVTLTVTNTGAFSGKYNLDGEMRPLKGRFNSDGHSDFSYDEPRLYLYRFYGKPALMIGFAMETDTDPKGSIFYYVDTLDEKANKTYHAYGDLHRATAPPSYLLGPNRAAAPYTGVLEATDYSTRTRFPDGSGLFNMGLHPHGVVTLVGLLPNETALTASTLFSADATAPCHFFLPFPIEDHRGYVASEIGFTDLNTPWLGVSTSRSLWVRPLWDSQRYGPDWPEALYVSMGFTRYRAIPGRSIFYAVDESGARTAPPSATGNMVLEVQVPGQSPIERRFNLNTADVVSRVPGEPTDFTIAVNRANGRFTGTVKLPDGKTPKFQGIVQQTPTSAMGDGYYVTVIPIVQTGTPHSRRVTVRPVMR